MNRRVFNFDRFVNESYTPSLNEGTATFLLEMKDDESAWKELVMTMQDNMPDIEKAVADTIKEAEPELAQELAGKLGKELDESLGLFTLIGGALSLGKALELVALIPKWIANKMDPDKKKLATQIFNWIDKKGNDYTHFIETKMILPLLKKTPGFKEWFNKQPQDTQKAWAKWTLTVLIIGLAMKGGIDTFKHIMHGNNIHAAIEGSITGVKSTEIVQNIASAVRTTTRSVIDIASVATDVGDEVVHAVEDIAAEG